MGQEVGKLFETPEYPEGELVGLSRAMAETGGRHPLERLALEASPQVIGIGGGGDSNDGQLHPMMNDLVLKRIFEYCPPEDLKSCRLVCAHWHRVSFPVWLQTGPPIRLYGSKPQHPWRTDLNAVKGRQMTGFLQEFHQGHGLEDNPSQGREILGIHQYRKFYILDHYDVDVNPSAKPITDGFWRGCGNWITNLHLANDIGWRLSKDFVGDILSCKFTPNLEQLHFHPFMGGSTRSNSLTLGGFEGEHHKNLKSFKFTGNINLSKVEWKLLLSHYPNLKCFVLSKYEDRTYSELPKILTSIKEIRGEDSAKLQLKTLTCLPYGDDEDDEDTDQNVNPPTLPNVHELLGACRLLDLETLGISFHRNITEATALQVCTMYGNTLKKLCLFRKQPFISPSPFAGEEEMSQLETLVAHGPVFQNLLFLNHLPNLRSLRFREDYEENFPPFPDILVATAGMEENIVFPPRISIFSCNVEWKWTVHHIDRLAEWTPNVTHLEIALTDESFQRVCQRFPNMEKLVVFGNRVGDKGIVGLVDRQTGGGGVVYRSPNIINLRKLRCFSMLYVSNWGNHGLEFEINFTEHSVLGGFLHLASLEELSIDVRPAPINPAVMLLIKSKIPFAKVVAAEGS